MLTGERLFNLSVGLNNWGIESNSQVLSRYAYAAQGPRALLTVTGLSQCLGIQREKPGIYPFYSPLSVNTLPSIGRMLSHTVFLG